MNNKKELVNQMLTIQDEVNSNVDSDWKSKGREWYRAAWIETAELIDSFNYKWWKNQEDDLDNAKIEAVDIWHFILAKCIESNVCSDIIVSHWKDNTSEDILVTIERLAFNLLKTKFEGASIVSVIEPFSQVCSHLGLTIENIYVYYLGKATLNNFRQDNGYKEGTYLKEWPIPNIHGTKTAQDNVFLSEILEDYLNKEVPTNLQEVIYNRLKELYPG